MTHYEISLYLTVAFMALTVFGALLAALVDIHHIGAADVNLLCPWCDHDHRGDPCTIRIYLARHA